MLEVRNLTKIYKTKGGADVRALDDISIIFDETGLVFLLGKSGSGKSTLLNMIGGLDAPTSGEVIVMGKSSKDFSGSDFDSYRNTYVGFVFQEYNVLNEFNVEDNVALALELQGKTHQREKVRQILDEVELGAFAKRKPNTLSGGQKQRIAIARALVKDPQIIMADEPTGALDSATGKQVFETLKKLSQTRLVIVVSHDRDFAEKYGDRIIELKDGKILSDVTKTRNVAEKVGDKIKKIDDNTLIVQGGSPDKETISRISEFLSQGEGEIIISKGETENQNFKRVNRIDENGSREMFVATNTDRGESNKYKEAKFIRSRLPAGKAFKIGASGLRLKPFRLILTIFLSFVSFVMFGLFSTMAFYNGNEVMINSFMSSDYDYLNLSKNYEVRETRTSSDGETYTYAYKNSALFTPAEVAELGGGRGFGAYSVDYSFGNLNYDLHESRYYRPTISYVSFCPQVMKFAIG